MKTTTHGGHAIVLGASIAGLLAARALSETFERVTVIDRDRLTVGGPRKGVPQGLHAHFLLAKGREVLEELFPGLTDDLAAAGATRMDPHDDLAWFNGPQPIIGGRSDVLALGLSRPALEDYVRVRVGQLSNVELLGGYEAVRLLASADRGAVIGVRVVAMDGADERDLAAHLVIDATGRSNRGPTWLTQLGYEPAREEVVDANVVYATRVYRRRSWLPSGRYGLLTGISPAYPYGTVVLPMELERWIVTTAGFGDDLPPTDVDGFNAFATRLPVEDVRHVVYEAEPLSEPRRFRVPASVRRRYEELTRQPDGYLAVGDALCAFNPLYAQGMTVAAMEALVLRDCLRASRAGLPQRFYAAAAKVIDIPWDMAVGGDLAYPWVEGTRTMKVRFLNAYLAKLLRAAETEEAVSLAFHRAINLTNGPEKLFAPGVLRRVLFPRRPPAPTVAEPAPITADR
jgi:2-polyprenyl-6-methoxyphenol hydroxylase-like FAD-dependent oxidoreductase